jgi:hypothetical protein
VNPQALKVEQRPFKAWVLSNKLWSIRFYAGVSALGCVNVLGLQFSPQTPENNAPGDS